MKHRINTGKVGSSTPEGQKMELEQICELLRDRKQQLIKVLNDFNSLCIEIADGLIAERYKDLGASIQQKVSEDDDGLTIGYYDRVVFADKTLRMQKLFRKEEVLEGHESKADKQRLRANSYASLKYNLALLYYNDFRRMARDSKKLDGVIAKFDSYNFSASELVALGHILAFEQVENIPITFSGPHPSYLTVLRSFEHTIHNREHINSDGESIQHKCFLNLYMDSADVNLGR